MVDLFRRLVENGRVRQHLAFRQQRLSIATAEMSLWVPFSRRALQQLRQAEAVLSVRDPSGESRPTVFGS